MALSYLRRRAWYYPRGPCLWLAALGLCAAAIVNLAGAERAIRRAARPAAPAGAYRESFESGEIDWAGEWDTDNGGDTYKALYRIDRMTPGLLFRDRQSYYSDAPHDYFNEEVMQVIKPYGQLGFWDPVNRNWRGRLLWSPRSGWFGSTSHEWVYSTELEEGALMSALISGNCAMDQCLALELQFIHGLVAADGKVASLGLPDNGFEYGTILSSLALGAIYFKQYVDPTVAQLAYGDMRRVFRYVATNYAVPIDPCEMMCVVVRGYANAYRAFDSYGETQLREAAGSCVEALAALLPRFQGKGGAFDLLDDTYRVQKQLKADIALLLADEVMGTAHYVDAVKRNVDWIIANRLDRSPKCNGGLFWCTDDTTAYFECHQMWFLIVSKYLEDRSGVSYASYRDDAVAFLTDDNFAGVDLYVDNWTRNNAFFAYRAISRDGSIQRNPFHQWKGAYEIGASLWAMALNYDSRTEGHHLLVTQAPEDSSDCWDKAIFSARDFGGGCMTFQWDAIFKDVRFPGAYTGLFNDQRGDGRILLDTNEGLSYRSRNDGVCILVRRERLVSGKRYTVKVDRLGASRMTIALLEDDTPLFEGLIEDAKPFDACYFGAFQNNGGALSAKNVFVDNIEFAPKDMPPNVCKLYRSYPNPFNQGITIEYDLATRGGAEIRIYDASGKSVATLSQGVLDPGHYRVRWDGKTREGAAAASGVYFCAVEAGGFRASEKLILLR